MPGTVGAGSGTGGAIDATMVAYTGTGPGAISAAGGGGAGGAGGGSFDGGSFDSGSSGVAAESAAGSGFVPG
ncbi:hypothetical protein NL444_28010, partial [Klebsiella pneumoniae]|nr:hypothetical protein [Klebsiella pneumoniae]